MKALRQQIAQCTICQDKLEHGVRPVVSIDKKSKIIIIGQAPGSRVHLSGIPWDDKSGENLRNWLDMDDETFYDRRIVGIIPMGFCYPGKGKSGDLPPRKECAPQWHQKIFDEMKEVELTLLIGKYAQDYYLGKNAKKNLTETVMHYKEYLPKYFVLPHPSPRNNIWRKKHPWFKAEVLPELKRVVKDILRVY